MRDRTTDLFGVALAWGGLALLLYLLYLVVAPFLAPLGWAAVFAILFHPVYAQLRRGWGPGRAALITTFTVAILVIGPLVILVSSFTREAIQAASTLEAVFAGGGSTRIESLWRNVEVRLPSGVRDEVNEFATDAVREIGTFVVAQSGALARSVAGFVATLVIALFATFFLLRDGDAIMRGVRRLLPMDHTDREALIVRTQELIAVGVVSSLVVAAVQGFLGGVVFAILGIPAPIFWGVIITLCCILPFGAWVIWMPTAVYLGINGDWSRALLLAGLGLGIVSGVDNILRPMLLSERANMNGLVIFVSLLGGVGVFGLLGLVLGPILVVTALALLNTYIESPRRERIEVTAPIEP